MLNETISELTWVIDVASDGVESKSLSRLKRELKYHLADPKEKYDDYDPDQSSQDQSRFSISISVWDFINNFEYGLKIDFEDTHY